MTLVTSAAQRSPIRQIGTHPLKIVALGDSLIYGYGDPEGGGWIERLRRHWMQLDEPGVILYNLGVRGDGVRQVAQRFETEFRCRGELRNRLPDGMILSIGMNDSAQLGRAYGRNFTEFEAFQAQMHQLLDQARQLCPVWVVGMIPVDEAKMPFADCLYYSQREQFRYKEATRQICQELNIPYLDIFEQWLTQGESWWRSRLCEDGLHPNVEGYRSLFEQVTHWQPLMEFVRQPNLQV